MRRIGRHMLNGLTALSLVACVGLAIMWWRSYGVHDFVGLPLGRAARMSAYSGEGRPSLNFAADVAKIPINDGWQRAKRVQTAEQWAADFDPRPNRYGFGFRVRRTPPNDYYWLHGHRLLLALWMPYWSLVIATALLPAVRLIRAARRRRRRRAARLGHCRKCGYDLRATPGRCPECGQAAAADAHGGGAA